MNDCFHFGNTHLELRDLLVKKGVSERNQSRSKLKMILSHIAGARDCPGSQMIICHLHIS